MPENSHSVRTSVTGQDHVRLNVLDNLAPATDPNVKFDWDGDGVADDTSWASATDGFLAIDLAADGTAGADGRIDQADELAFSRWVKGADAEEVSDLEGLRRVFDSNNDNILTALDDRWNEFRIWQDFNQNGVSDAGELKTMSEAGATLIGLVPSSDGAQTFADGSKITGTTSYQTADGKQHLVADVSLAWKPTDTPAG